MEQHNNFILAEIKISVLMILNSAGIVAGVHEFLQLFLLLLTCGYTGFRLYLLYKEKM